MRRHCSLFQNMIWLNFRFAMVLRGNIVYYSQENVRNKTIHVGDSIWNIKDFIMFAVICLET